MKFSLNGSEMADWMECWCFRCANEHGFSHVPESEQTGDGCPIILKTVLHEDAPEFTAHGEAWFRTIPAGVVCSAFTPCRAVECNDQGREEKRGGLTQREYRDWLRAETISLPQVEVSE